MSSDVSTSLASSGTKREMGLLVRWQAVMVAWLAWAGDRLNPILVKETRQALKSRQFVVTFGLVLLAAWIWTIGALAWLGPAVWYGAKGPDVFLGYYCIMAFPMLVVVPAFALRSLAGEHEDRTYDLLSITALGPRQIVAGKLGSAALQTLIYLSAIAPCLAFTYMLRGIDLLTIALVTGCTVLASLGLSMLGLMVGTLTSEKHWQVVLGALSVVGLFFAFGGGCGLVGEILWYGQSMLNEPGFWDGMACALTAYLSYFALVFFAAAARLSFAGANRSTPIRVVMVLQQVLLAGWIAWFWLTVPGESEVIAVVLIMLGAHWFVMGAMMTGESPQMSPRVKRRLPQSLLGRALLTWFNPGPGTGYVLALSGMAAAVLITAAIFYLGLAPEPINPYANIQRSFVPTAPANPSWWQTDPGRFIAIGILTLSYLAIYLGLGLFLFRLLRKVARVGVPAALLFTSLLAVAGTIVPMVLQQMSPVLRYQNYTLLQITNAPWSLGQAAEEAFYARSTTSYTEVMMMVLPVLALGVFLMNLPGIVREVRQVRIAKPRRVAEEDALLAPTKQAPSSPWG